MFPKSFFRYKDKDINWSVISINFNDQEEPPLESGTFSVIQATTIPTIPQHSLKKETKQTDL